MVAPLTTNDLLSPETIKLGSFWRPIGRYEIRDEGFGYVLLGPGIVMAVSYEAKPVLKMCNGEVTLKEIEECYGQQGIALIAELYKKGLVEWAVENNGTEQP